MYLFNGIDFLKNVFFKKGFHHFQCHPIKHPQSILGTRVSWSAGRLNWHLGHGEVQTESKPMWGSGWTLRAAPVRNKLKLSPYIVITAGAAWLLSVLQDAAWLKGLRSSPVVYYWDGVEEAWVFYSGVFGVRGRQCHGGRHWSHRFFWTCMPSPFRFGVLTSITWWRGIQLLVSVERLLYAVMTEEVRENWCNGGLHSM